MSRFTIFSIKLATLGKFWQEPVNSQALRWNLLFILTGLIYLFFRFNDLPPTVPLYFSLPWGESELAPAVNLFILPGFSIVITLINYFLAIFLLDGNRLLSRLLVIFSSLFSCLSLVALFEIINLIV
jgi:hypothetical protein